MDPPWRCGKHPGFGYDTTTRQRTGGTSITIHQLSNLFFSYHRQKFILLLRTLNLHCIVQETSLFVYQYSILLGSYLQVATSYDDTNSLDDVLLRLACSWRGARRRHHRLAPRPQSVGGNPLSCNRLCEKSNPPFDIRRYSTWRFRTRRAVSISCSHPLVCCSGRILRSSCFAESDHTFRLVYIVFVLNDDFAIDDLD
jgi:hypothetical protein